MAKDAMTLLVKTGTISGNDGMLAPTVTSTRMEMAQVLFLVNDAIWSASPPKYDDAKP